ncbi:MULTISPECIES: hypothetical protein [Vibrio]|uniref:hypothetical protein n=1 Tax=Vibrio TaxID=662 RepID=UPI0007EED790|nr:MULTISPECIES: hypothetical protein [Vibrio]OBT29449.1 hypothetical protein A9263_05155 [Vibrio cyclitrophicus]ROO74363.1 hypothetical protein EDB57_0794 [Vibrio crassostreae]
MRKFFKYAVALFICVSLFVVGYVSGHKQAEKLVPQYSGIFKKMNGDEVQWEAPAEATLRWRSGQYEIRYKTPDGDSAYTAIDPSFGDMCGVMLGMSEKLVCWNNNSNHKIQNFSFEGTEVMQ